MFDALKKLLGRRTRPEKLPPKVAAALTALLEHAKYELIPLKNVHDQAGHLPAGATVSVTASPAKGMDATIDLAADLADRGFAVIPHLSARLTKDRAQLEGILSRLDSLGIRRAFVVGGDADDPGDFFDALSLLEAMKDLGHGLTEIGIAGYPEGHAVISDEKLLQALADKQLYANYMATQMCFDPAAITSWIDDVRGRGINLPVHVGIPGVAPLLKLASISTRIGIGASVRYLSKQHGLLGKLARPGGYAPDELLTGLGQSLVDPKAAIEGIHIFSFNQVDTTEEWRLQMLRELGAA